MKKEPPPEARAKASTANKKPKTHPTEAFLVLQTSSGIDTVPHIRSLPSSDRQDTVDLWWNLRLQGVRLPAQEGVIVLQGWRR